MIKVCSRVIGGIGAAALVLGLGAQVNAQSITVGSVEGAPGTTVQVPVMWTAGSSGATGLTIDIDFGDQPFEGGTAGCTYTAELLAIKAGSMFALRPPRCTIGGDPACTAVRAGIVDFGANNTTPIPDMTLYNCAVAIPAGAAQDTEFPYEVVNASFILPSGAETDITDITNGSVTVGEPVPPTATVPAVTPTNTPPAGTPTNTPRPTGVGGGGGGDDDGCQVVAGSQSNAAWLLLIPAAVLLVQRRRSR